MPETSDGHDVDACGGRVTVAQALAAARRRLRAAGVPSPEVDAGALLRHVTGWRHEQLLLRGARSLAPGHLAAFDAAVSRRARRTPLQHLTGRVGFRRLELEVAEGVFIPRPETEVLVDLTLAAAPSGALVVEPCTGSGAVAAALADERPDLSIVATDIDPAAVQLARRNTAGAGGRVTVLRGDLLTPLDDRVRGMVDVLVSNPPYLAAGELDGLEPEVTRGDPHAALVAGRSGHETSDRLIAAGTTWLAPGGTLLMEVDLRRADAVAVRCTAAGYRDVVIAEDLTGAARVVRARRPEGRADAGASRVAWDRLRPLGSPERFRAW